MVLSHTSTLELQEFWKLFAMEPGDGAAQLDDSRRKEQGEGSDVDIGTIFSPGNDCEDGTFARHENPMVKNMEGMEAAKAGSEFLRTHIQDLPPDLEVTTDWACNPMLAVDQEEGGAGGQMEAVL